MFLSNHSSQVLIPHEACVITVEYDMTPEDFYSGSKHSAVPMSTANTVTLSVIGNGAKFSERYRDKAMADAQLGAMADAIRKGEPIFAFAYDARAEELRKESAETRRRANESKKAAYADAAKGEIK